MVGMRKGSIKLNTLPCCFGCEYFLAETIKIRDFADNEPYSLDVRVQCKKINECSRRIEEIEKAYPPLKKMKKL